MADIRPIDANAMHKFVEEKAAEGKDGWANGVPYEWAYALTAVDMQPTLDYVPRQQWISVKDRLPEDCIDQSKDVKQIKVMVAIKAKNGWTVRTQMRCKDVHSRFYGASPDIIWYWRHFSAGEITHWMPLPEPPKEET